MSNKYYIGDIWQGRQNAQMEEMYLLHYGRSKLDGAPKGSGRYPLGSGKNPIAQKRRSGEQSVAGMGQKGSGLLDRIKNRVGTDKTGTTYKGKSIKEMSYHDLKKALEKMENYNYNTYSKSKRIDLNPIKNEIYSREHETDKEFEKMYPFKEGGDTGVNEWGSIKYSGDDNNLLKAYEYTIDDRVKLNDNPKPPKAYTNAEESNKALKKIFDDPYEEEKFDAKVWDTIGVNDSGENMPTNRRLAKAKIKMEIAEQRKNNGYSEKDARMAVLNHYLYLLRENHYTYPRFPENIEKSAEKAFDIMDKYYMHDLESKSVPSYQQDKETRDALQNAYKKAKDDYLGLMVEELGYYNTPEARDLIEDIVWWD